MIKVINTAWDIFRGPIGNIEPVCRNNKEDKQEEEEEEEEETAKSLKKQNTKKVQPSKPVAAALRTSRPRFPRGPYCHSTQVSGETVLS
jgi:hypothetical protein